MLCRARGWRGRSCFWPHILPPPARPGQTPHARAKPAGWLAGCYTCLSRLGRQQARRGSKPVAAVVASGVWGFGASACAPEQAAHSSAAPRRSVRSRRGGAMCHARPCRAPLLRLTDFMHLQHQPAHKADDSFDLTLIPYAPTLGSNTRLSVVLQLFCSVAIICCSLVLPSCTGPLGYPPVSMSSFDDGGISCQRVWFDALACTARLVWRVSWHPAISP